MSAPAQPSAQLIAVLGSGGVGKTTSSAALALGLAHQGLRTAVITVDPAHRLASVLGLKSLNNEAQEIARFENGGSLSALWLDTSQALVELVQRHADRLQNLEKILQHRLFKVIQSQLGGVEEYLGVERILALRASGKYDVLILDTPPSRHALDFLESPRHLLRFFDEGVLKFFLDADENAGPSGFFSKVFRSGRDQVLDVFKNLLGSTFLGELSDLLRNLKPVHSVFTETANGIETWVREPSTRFVIVSLYEPYPLDEAHLLRRELRERGLPGPHLMLLNKSLPSIDVAQSQLSDTLGPEATEALLRSFESQKTLRAQLLEDVATMNPVKPAVKLAVAEVRRYSVKQLSREQLMRMGLGILEKWDPNNSSKP